MVHCALCTGSNHQQGQWQPKKVEAFQDRVVAVSAGRDHSLALTADGALWSWGDGGFGKLGHGDQQSQLLPKEVEAMAGQRVDLLLWRWGCIRTASPSPPTAQSGAGAGEAMAGWATAMRRTSGI